MSQETHWSCRYYFCWKSHFGIALCYGTNVLLNKVVLMYLSNSWNWKKSWLKSFGIKEDVQEWKVVSKGMSTTIMSWSVTKFVTLKKLILYSKHTGEIKCHKKHTDPVDKMSIQKVILESHYITDPKVHWKRLSWCIYQTVEIGNSPGWNLLVSKRMSKNEKWYQRGCPH